MVSGQEAIPDSACSPIQMVHRRPGAQQWTANRNHSDSTPNQLDDVCLWFANGNSQALVGQIRFTQPPTILRTQGHTTKVINMNRRDSGQLPQRPNNNWDVHWRHSSHHWSQPRPANDLHSYPNHFNWRQTTNNVCEHWQQRSHSIRVTRN